jgi:hypothetical protein
MLLWALQLSRRVFLPNVAVILSAIHLILADEIKAVAPELDEVVISVEELADHV